MSLPVSLISIGSSHTLSFQQLEQVSALIDGGVEVGGTTATRTYAAEFRWGTDGSTWTSWLTFNTATVAAQVLDADELFYLEVKVTRTGSDNTGLLTWNRVALDYDIDPTAVSGHGSVVDLTIQTDLQALFKALIESKLPLTASNSPRYSVATTFPQGQSRKGGLHPIYVYDFQSRGSNTDRMGGTLSAMNYRVRIAVKTIAEQSTDRIQGAPLNEFAMGIIRRLFERVSWHYEQYAITFKGVVFPAAYLQDFGIREVSLDDSGIFAGDNDYYQVFSVNFTLDQSVVNSYPYTIV